MNESRNYRVFCPRCGDAWNTKELPDMIRRVIDRPCRRCGLLGVDAFETDRPVSA